MPADPVKVFAFCRAIAESTDDELPALDDDGLEAMKAALIELRGEIDRTLLRLSILDETGLPH